MKRIIRLFVLICGFSNLAYANHSMTVISAEFGDSSATFTGQSTAASSLGLPMEGRVCDLGNTSMFAGNTHTFTSVGENFVFTVNYPSGTFPAGKGLVSITDDLASTDCNFGDEGYEGVQPVAAASSIPTMPIYGLALTVAGLLLVANRRLRLSFKRD
jgi:hypothetical protein